MESTSVSLSNADLYALSRALVGLDSGGVAISPAVALILTNLKPIDRALLTRMLGIEAVAKIFAIDPNSPPPTASAERTGAQPMPPLKPGVALSDEQIRLAKTAGRWLDDYMAWAGSVANETPLSFHEAGAIWLGAIAIGRRVHFAAPWFEEVYPNLYIMVCGISTYYRKSSGLRMAEKVAKRSIPHMLMPNPGSPESFQNMLAAQLPSNFESLSATDQARIRFGMLYAAQRGIIRDELSALFKSMGKDYMAGMKELLMELYDAPNYKDYQTQNKGLIIIRDAALSIFGATTPAELAISISVGDWHNGQLARFAIITPETDYRERPAQLYSTPPTELANRLRHLHEILPMPVTDNSDPARAESWSLVCKCVPEILAYEDNLRWLTRPESGLDDRLRATYGRMHVHGIKVAEIFACMDWADIPSEQRPERPVVEKQHWYRAQMIVEGWRDSIHRAILSLSQSAENVIEDRVLAQIRSVEGGLTKRELRRRSGMGSKEVNPALDSLLESGLVVSETVPSAGGQTKTVYRTL